MSPRNGRQIDVEIQILPTGPMPERSLFYWARMYAGQIKAGDSSHKLKKCITINIVYFDCIPGHRLHTCFHLSEDTTCQPLTQGRTGNLLPSAFRLPPSAFRRLLTKNSPGPCPTCGGYFSIAAKCSSFGTPRSILSAFGEMHGRRMYAPCHA
jgi:hypothetical protein